MLLRLLWRQFGGFKCNRRCCCLVVTVATLGPSDTFFPTLRRPSPTFQSFTFDHSYRRLSFRRCPPRPPFLVVFLSLFRSVPFFFSFQDILSLETRVQHVSFSVATFTNQRWCPNYSFFLVYLAHWIKPWNGRRNYNADLFLLFWWFFFFPRMEAKPANKKKSFRDGIFLRFFADRRVELCLSRVAIAAEGLIWTLRLSEFEIRRPSPIVWRGCQGRIDLCLFELTDWSSSDFFKTTTVTQLSS